MTTLPLFILYIAISKNAMGMLVFLIAITIPLSLLIHWRIRNFLAASICSALLADVIFQWYSYSRNGSIASAFLISIIFVGIYAFIISSFVGSLFKRKRKTQRCQCMKCGYVHVVNDNGDCSKCGSQLSEPLESQSKLLNEFKFDKYQVVGFVFCCLAMNLPGILWHIPILRLAIMDGFFIWLKIPEFLFSALDGTAITFRDSEIPRGISEWTFLYSFYIIAVIIAAFFLLLIFNKNKGSEFRD